MPVAVCDLGVGRRQVDLPETRIAAVDSGQDGRGRWCVGPSGPAGLFSPATAPIVTNPSARPSANAGTDFRSRRVMSHSLDVLACFRAFHLYTVWAGRQARSVWARQHSISGNKPRRLNSADHLFHRAVIRNRELLSVLPVAGVSAGCCGHFRTELRNSQR